MAKLPLNKHHQRQQRSLWPCRHRRRPAKAPRDAMAGSSVFTRVGTSVCQVTRDKKELDLTESDMGCNLFLLSFGCDSSRYYRGTHGTALIPNETQCSCRTPVACLVFTPKIDAPENAFLPSFPRRS